MADDRRSDLADALWRAEQSRTPIEPLTAQHADLVIEDVYAIQGINVQRRIDSGARVIGRKVGLTSKPMQKMLGVSEPDYGVLLDDMYVEERIQLIDTVSDNASCGLLTFGVTMTPVAGLDLRLIGVAMSRNGEVIDTGAGAAALGNPARCVAWLANKFASFGASLRAGDIILPGAVHRMVPVQPGDVFRAEFAQLGAVTAVFSGGNGAGRG